MTRPARSLAALVAVACIALALAFPAAAWPGRWLPTPTPAGAWTPPPRTKTASCSYAFLPLQDAACTPGSLNPDVTQATIRQTICVSGWTSTVRNVPASEKAQAAMEYFGKPQSQLSVEYDHLVPLELGGANDLSNIWPEPLAPKPGFRVKDHVENWLRQQVCAGHLRLNDAQREIATDWVSAAPYAITHAPYLVPSGT